VYPGGGPPASADTGRRSVGPPGQRNPAWGRASASPQEPRANERQAEGLQEAWACSARALRESQPSRPRRSFLCIPEAATGVSRHRPKVCRPTGPEETSLGQSVSVAPGTGSERDAGRRSAGTDACVMAGIPADLRPAALGAVLPGATLSSAPGCIPMPFQGGRGNDRRRLEWSHRRVQGIPLSRGGEFWCEEETGLRSSHK
jgi:hypothetical protein